MIRVTDNGDGMDESDCLLSFERHATSKINSGSDLEMVSSLGFRGEAMASIAAVSQVEMFSCLKEADVGTHIINHGGEVISKKGYGCPKGTSIIVRNLFYNVPARLKFLKSTRAEASGIAELMSRLILSRPDVSFKYIYEDKTVFTSSGDGSLLSAIVGVYGNLRGRSPRQGRLDPPSRGDRIPGAEHRRPGGSGGRHCLRRDGQGETRRPAGRTGGAG